MNKSELQEQIEAYINHTMPPEALQTWEQRMAGDASLREEVALHRQIQQDFDAGRLRLRASLSDVMNEPLPPETPSGPGKKRRWGLWFGLLGIVLVSVCTVWLWKKPVQTVPTSVPASPVPSEAPAVPQTPDVAPPAPRRPMAIADPIRFKTNPGMEAFVHSKVRSESIEVKMVRPINSVRLTPDEKGIVRLRFKGTIKGQDDQPLNQLVLSILDNSNAGKPILEVPVPGPKGTDNSLEFDFRQPLNLQTGLYYFTIEELDKGEVLYAGKFLIVSR